MKFETIYTDLAAISRTIRFQDFYNAANAHCFVHYMYSLDNQSASQTQYAQFSLYVQKPPFIHSVK